MSAGSFWEIIGSRSVLHVRGLLIVCAVIVALSPASAFAQCNANQPCVNYTSHSTTGASSSSTLTWSHSMANGVYRAIVVGVSIRYTGAGSIPQVSSVTFGTGTPVSLNYLQAASSTDGTKRAEIWGVADNGSISVPIGTHTVSVTLSGAAELIGGAVSFTGVDPDVPFNATAQQNEGTDISNYLVAPGTTSICVDVGAIEGNLTASVLSSHTDQTSRWNSSTGTGLSSNLRGFGSTRPGQGPPFTRMAWVGSSSTKWAAAATEVIPQNETSIRLASVSAEARYPRGVSLRWRTGGESGTLGFILYREGANGEFSAVNREIVAGSALTTGATLKAGYSYSWEDPDGAAGDRYWLEEIEISGERRRYGPYTARAGVDTGRTVGRSLTLNRVAIAENGAGVTTIPGIAASVKFSLKENIERQLELAGDASAIKIGVRERGWYRITQQELTAAGFDSNGDANTLQLFTSGVEVPIRVSNVGSGTPGAFNAIEFYGLGVDEASTDTRVYWLVAGDEPGLRITNDVNGARGSELQTVPYRIELRERLVYVASFANGEENNFYGAVLMGEPVERTLAAPSVDLDSTTPASLELVVQGFSDGPHEVLVELNGVSLTTLSGSDQDVMGEMISVPAGLLREGDNTLRLTAGPRDDISLVDVVRLQYPRRSLASGDELLVTVPDEIESMVIGGFTAPGAVVLDVSDPFNPVDLTIHQVNRDGGRRAGGTQRATVDPAGSPKNESGSFNARFALPVGSSRTLHAIGASRVLQPAWIQANVPSSWHSSENGSDVLMVAAREMIPALQPLVDYRQAQGYTVSVAAVEDVYDEFGFGIKRTDAIRDLVVEANDHWQQPPSYLILVGDASYDPRNYLGHGSVDAVPTRFIATDAFEAASDDWFGDVDGDSVADLMVGRLPVKTPDDLGAFVSKTIEYDQNGATWSEAMYVSDDDMGQQFESSTSLLKSLLPSLEPNDVTIRLLGNSGAQSAVLDGLNQGVDLVSYIGHGSVQTWSGDVLTVDVVDQLDPGSSPAVFTMMNCMNGYFFDAALDSLAEALLAADAGAIAVFAPTGISGWAPQEPMMAALYEMLETSETGTTLGEAVAAAKASAGSEDVRRTWVILGDPMIKVR